MSACSRTWLPRRSGCWNPTHRPSIELQAEFAADGSRLLVGFKEGLRELVGRGGERDGAGFLYHVAIVGRAHDRPDLAIEERDHGLRRSGSGAEAEPAEAQK